MLGRAVCAVTSVSDERGVVMRGRQAPRVLVVDDHSVVRSGVIQILKPALPGATFGEAGNAAQALAAIRAQSWDLVLLDRAPGSSLDPSADAGTHLTTRCGFDLTAPLETAGKSFYKAAFPAVDLKKFGL